MQAKEEREEVRALKQEEGIVELSDKARRRQRAASDIIGRGRLES